MSPQELVRAAGYGRFESAGAAFWPHGVNSYPLLQHAGAARWEAIADIFEQALRLGRPLVRTLAFMDSGSSQARIRDERGELREQGLRALDAVLAHAALSGVRVLLVLSNYWQDFGGAPAVMRQLFPHVMLPTSAFFTEPRAVEAQLAYQAALVERVNTVNGRRYAEDPCIFAWELMNEPRCEPAVAQAGRTLAAWARRMSDGLRSAGVRQLIAWGGAGYLSQHGEDLRLIAAHGGVDVLTMHMYGTELPRWRRLGGIRGVIRWGESALQQRASVARRANLPLLLEEVGWKPRAARGAPNVHDQDRARVLAAWLDAAHARGICCLPWMIGERGRADHDGYLIRPEDDATSRVLRRTAVPLSDVT